MAIRTASLVVSIAGGLALLTGLLVWTGLAVNLISLHMLLGILALGALCVAAIGQAFAKNGSLLLVLAALAVGAGTVYAGLYQRTFNLGDFAWAAQVLHVVLGILAIGLGHIAAARYRRSLQ